MSSSQEFNGFEKRFSRVLFQFFFLIFNSDFALQSHVFFHYILFEMIF